MKNLLLVNLMMTFFIGFYVKADNYTELIGKWQYSSYRYQDQESPISNPDLILIYEFNQDGTSHLFWTWKNSHASCERQGKFESSATELYDLVTWVSPSNHSSCSSDPDMQINKQSRVTYRIQNSKLEIDLPLSSDHLTYIWTKIN